MKKAKGSPTKKMLVVALVSDLDIIEAIEDLVDNSVDAALRSNEKGRFDGYWIKIRFSKDDFLLEDNCGGMSLDIAENIAFRLGRPDNYSGHPGQVGRFGVGMKRDLFRLGQEIRVYSKTETSSFTVVISLPAWLQKPDNDWDFDFEDVKEGIRIPKEEAGVRIVVSDLSDEATQQFRDPTFHATLVDRLQKAHKHSVENGMQIIVNGTPLTPQPYKLKESPNIAPAHFSLSYNGHGKKAVKVRIVAGIDDNKAREAGWYVACNGRFILVADQSFKTGWGESGDVPIPKMHGQFARFRGFAFFECEDPARLPWNSTKTGLNTESAVFRAARQLIVLATRPVIDFLNEVDKELDADDRPLTDAIDQAEAKPVSTVLAETVNVARRNFKGTPIATKNDPDRAIRISYTKPLRLVKKVRELLGTDVNREIGSKTFDYYYDNERR